MIIIFHKSQLLQFLNIVLNQGFFVLYAVVNWMQSIIQEKLKVIAK